MSSPNAGAPSSRRQKRMGPAPFASFEDLSDELDSPEEKIAASTVRLPGIREDATPSTPALPEPEIIYAGISLVGGKSKPPSPTNCMASTLGESLTSNKTSLQAPTTPRIDISRASSSSQHEDSRDSTPERELFDGQGTQSTKLGLAFKEEGTLDLRSSTEELDFHDQTEKLKNAKARPQSPCPQEELYCYRKDSQSSEIGLLSISGRTSRLSSIGSQGSAQSRLSNASHLSVLSGQSGRSPSPHKMLLETSFCGPKQLAAAAHTATHAGTKADPDEFEKVLLSRKHDPREALLAEGIRVQKEPRKTDIKITVNTPQQPSKNDATEEKAKIPKTIISASGVQYTYIPLKGPLPQDYSVKPREIKSASTTTRNKGKTPIKPKSKSASSSPAVQKSRQPQQRSSLHHASEPKYIRIKLKPDYMYEDEPSPQPHQSSNPDEIRKPICLDLNDPVRKPVQSFSQILEDNQITNDTPPPNKLTASPKPVRHTLKEKTPSPSLSRRSSFTSLFRSRETVASPESPTVTHLRRKNTLTGLLKDAGEHILERTRSRSKSRDRDRSSVSTAPSSTESIDSKSKSQKSVLSLFKPKKTAKDRTPEPPSPDLGSLTQVQFKFNSGTQKYYENPLKGESIRIPLHSPHQHENASILEELKTSSQDSQETVIETKCVEAVIETVDKPTSIDHNKRQSSTSSENVIFSTNLGSSNELFTTKLPKEKAVENGDIGLIKSPNSPRDTVCVVSINETVKGDVNLNSLEVAIDISKETVTPVYDSKEVPITKESLQNSAADEDRHSSESERDSEIDYLKNNKKESGEKSDSLEPERKGLVYQQDSYDDDLPYVPTTLPQERSVAVPIVPVKQRTTYEMKTYSIDRPRSTTPINLSTLEDYCEDASASTCTEHFAKTIEKLKISLPRDEPGTSKSKSPRKPTAATNWFIFSEKTTPSPVKEDNAPPPPLPPKNAPKEWINFEEIPERRKPPRRIQTIPSRGVIEVPESVLQEHVVYSYVNPEDCKCECHEIARERDQSGKQETPDVVKVQEDEVPLLEDDAADEDKSMQDSSDRNKLDVADRRSVISDSSIDLSTSLDNAETSAAEPILRTPFTGDLEVASNRSSASQDS